MDKKYYTSDFEYKSSNIPMAMNNFFERKEDINQKLTILTNHLNDVEPNVVYDGMFFLKDNDPVENERTLYLNYKGTFKPFVHINMDGTVDIASGGSGGSTGTVTINLASSNVTGYLPLAKLSTGEDILENSSKFIVVDSKNSIKIIDKQEILDEISNAGAVDLSNYATLDSLKTKADANHNHDTVYEPIHNDFVYNGTIDTSKNLDTDYIKDGNYTVTGNSIVVSVEGKQYYPSILHLKTFGNNQLQEIVVNDNGKNYKLARLVEISNNGQSFSIINTDKWHFSYASDSIRIDGKKIKLITKDEYDTGIADGSISTSDISFIEENVESNDTVFAVKSVNNNYPDGTGNINISVSGSTGNYINQDDIFISDPMGNNYKKNTSLLGFNKEENKWIRNELYQITKNDEGMISNIDGIICSNGGHGINKITKDGLATLLSVTSHSIENGQNDLNMITQPDIEIYLDQTALQYTANLPDNSLTGGEDTFAIAKVVNYNASGKCYTINEVSSTTNLVSGIPILMVVFQELWLVSYSNTYSLRRAYLQDLGMWTEWKSMG